MAITGLLQVVAGTVVVRSSGFLQDDYLYLAPRQKGFTLHGLTTSVFGSLIPGFSLADTLMARMHPISRWPLMLTVVALYAVVVFLFYMLLELLFGARPAIVAFTAIASDEWAARRSSSPGGPRASTRFPLSRQRSSHCRGWSATRRGPTSPSDHRRGRLCRGRGLLRPKHGGPARVGALHRALLADPCDWRSVGRALRTRTILWIGCAIPIALNLSWRRLHPTEYTLPPVAGTGKLLRFMGAGWAQGFAPSTPRNPLSSIGTTTGRWQAVVVGQALIVGFVVVSLIRRPSAWRAWAWFGASSSPRTRWWPSAGRRSRSASHGIHLLGPPRVPILDRCRPCIPPLTDRDQRAAARTPVPPVASIRSARTTVCAGGSPADRDTHVSVAWALTQSGRVLSEAWGLPTPATWPRCAPRGSGIPCRSVRIHLG